MKTLYLFAICLIMGICPPCQATKNTETEDESMTVLLNVDSVLNAYIAAIGGWENVKAIKDMTLVYNMQINGKEVVRKVRPDQCAGRDFFCHDDLGGRGRKIQIGIGKK